MSSPSSPTLICDVHSRRAERWIALLALAATAAVPFLISTPDSAVRAALFATFVLLVWGGLWRAGWIGGRRILGLSWLYDGRWLLTDDRNMSIGGTLRSDSRAGSRWVWLRWDTRDRPWGGRSMLLVAGDLPSRQLRRLIVRLRIEGGSQSNPRNYPVRGREAPGSVIPSP